MSNDHRSELWSQGQAHGGDVWGASRRLGLKVHEVLDLSASLNPLGPPPGLAERLAASLEQICLYPDRQCLELRHALAAEHGLDPLCFLPGNGAPSLLNLLARALTSRDILVLAPAFGEIARSLALAGGHFHFHMLNEREGFAPTAHDLDSIWQQEPACVILSNPLIPTGGLVEPEWLDQLMTTAQRRKAWVVLDESFMLFAPQAARDWAPALINKHPRLVVLRSLAKFYCLAGLRLSYLTCHPETTVQLAPLGEPWSVSTPAQAAGVFCMDQNDYAEKTRRAVALWRQAQESALAELGIEVFPGQVNYMLANLPSSGPTASQAQDACLEQGVLVRDCSMIPGCGPRHLRLAVAADADQPRLIAALQNALAG